MIDRIQNIKATINLEGVDQTVEKKPSLQYTTRTEMSCRLKSALPSLNHRSGDEPEQKIPVKVDRKGSLPDGISISSLDISPGEVTVYGPQMFLIR
ncbi:CdaR family protein [Bacillus licheniformis]|nr:CdaR family protein [Bacillus licheniformis]